MDTRTILIIEDEEDLADILSEYLGVEGFDTIVAHDGEEGISLFHNLHPQMVLLDIMLPKLNGIEVCKKIRMTSDVPILILSAKDGEMDKVISLGTGADDYITKPFSPLELIARVKAHMRRYENSSPKESTSGLSVGKLILHKDRYEAYVEETRIELTTKEFEVLTFFAENQNHVFSKEQIYDQVWGQNEYGDISSVAVYIKRLRRKLEQFDIDYIKTVWGVGYKMTV